METKQEPKRVLHVVSQMGRGGAETLIMNMYRHMDRTKVQFDFIVHQKVPGDYDQEIMELGGNIYYVPSLGASGPYPYLKNLIAIMSVHPYAAVHAHTDYQGGFPALAAKICGIHNRICHSHSSDWLKQAGFKEWLILKTLQKLIAFSATTYCSCSHEAAAFLFGKNKKVKVLKNGIDPSEYRHLDATCKKSVSTELHLPKEAIMIGHVGRFSRSKNQLYILHVLQKLLEDDGRYFVIFIGEGPLKREVETEAKRRGLYGHIRFLGQRSDIPRFMAAFDVFLFPSTFEGFGMVMLESQCAGTPCIASVSVPEETDIGLGMVQFLRLEQNVQQWCEAVKAAIAKEVPDREAILNKLTERGFHASKNMGEWLRLYGVPTEAGL